MEGSRTKKKSKSLREFEFFFAEMGLGKLWKGHERKKIQNRFAILNFFSRKRVLENPGVTPGYPAGDPGVSSEKIELSCGRSCGRVLWKGHVEQ